MKNISLSFYIMLATSSLAYSNNTTHYPFINKLSNDSKLKLMCQTHQSSRFELSETESACSTLNHRLGLLFNDVHAISDFLIINESEAHDHIESIVLQEDIEKAIAKILKDESDLIKIEEYEKVYISIANYQIRNKIDEKRLIFIVSQSPRRRGPVYRNEIKKDAFCIA